jgi:phage terminase large subunit
LSDLETKAAILQSELNRRSRLHDTPDPSIQYNFRGSANLIQDGSRHVYILSSGSETGKTIANLSFLNKLARKYPGMQGAIVRKWRADMDSTCLLQFRQKVLGEHTDVKIFGGEKPERYIYPNGSTVWVGGIDRPGAALSGERDAVCVVQAEELNIEDWETLSTRTTGRAGIITPAFLFGDCNPRGSSHWILQLAKAGALELLPMFHTDNPLLYDDAGKLTEQGKRTLERLQNLTGVRRERLLEHKWVTPEGAVYDTFDRNMHVKVRAVFKTWYLALDEGYTNPAVILLIGEDGDKRLHVAREFYKRGVLPSEQVRVAIEWAREIGVAKVIVDQSAAGLIAELRNSGLTVFQSSGKVRDGIALVHERLKIQGDGLPRLTIEPSCIETISEFESYVYKTGSEEPVKENDHALDSIRYLISDLDRKGGTWVPKAKGK